MKTRLELQKELEEILGSREVYYQPKSNVSMKYPAIRYSLEALPAEYANNKRYVNKRKFVITHMYKSVKNDLKSTILNHFVFIRFDRTYIGDGLYHDVYELYY